MKVLRNLPSNVKARYGENYFTSGYERDPRRYFKALTYLGNLSNKLILDAACGTGEASIMVTLARGKVISADFSKYAIRVCKSKKRDMEVVLASITNLPFRQEAFDMVLALEVIDEMPHEIGRKALSEISYVLKRSGKLVIQVMPNKVLAYVWHKLLRKNLKHNYDYLWFPWELRRTVASFFSIERVEIDSIPFMGRILFHYKSVPIFLKPLAYLFGNDIWYVCTKP